MARRAALYSGKGGVGKTSLVNGLAAAAAAQGLRVCVIDSDPRATATKELGVDTRRLLTLNDLLNLPDGDEDPVPAEKAIRQVIHPAGGMWPGNVHVVPAERKLGNRETDFAPFDFRLAQGLDAIDDEYDLFLADMPPRPGGRLSNVILNAMGSLLLPATLTTDGYDGVLEGKMTARKFKAAMNPRLKYAGIVRSIVPKKGDRRAIHNEIDRRLTEEFPGEVLDIQVTEYAVREECRYACAPVTLATEPDADALQRPYAKRLVEAYGQLVDHLMDGKEIPLV